MHAIRAENDRIADHQSHVQNACLERRLRAYLARALPLVDLSEPRVLSRAGQSWPVIFLGGLIATNLLDLQVGIVAVLRRIQSEPVEVHVEILPGNAR